MRTIGTRWPRSAPRGDFTATCDYCGVPWRRSQLRRDRAGRMSCPDEGPGLTSIECDLEAARAALGSIPRIDPSDAGSSETYPPVATPEPVVVYENPYERLGARVVGWYTLAASYVTLSGSDIVTVVDRGGNGNDMTSPFPILRFQLTTDPQLGIGVAGTTGLLQGGVSGVSRAVPMNLFATAKLNVGSASGNASAYVSGSSASMSDLRSSAAGIRGRYWANEFSGYEPATPPTWRRYGIVWTDSGESRLVVDGATVSARTAVSLPEAPTAIVIGDGAAMGYIAELTVVSGVMSDTEIDEQMGWMAQYAGL